MASVRAWLSVVVLTMGILLALAIVGPPGSAYRANEDYAVCMADLAAGPTSGSDEEWFRAAAECDLSCDAIATPSALEALGLFVQTRLPGTEDEPSCVGDVGFGDFLPGLEPQIRSRDPGPTASLDCRHPIDALGEVPEGYRSVAGAIALPSEGVAHQLSDVDPGTGLRFAKMGLLVRNGATATLRLLDPSGTGVMFWGNTGRQEDAASRFDVPGCESRSSWSVYPGGISVADAGCVGVAVRSGAEAEIVWIGLGTAC